MNPSVAYLLIGSFAVGLLGALMGISVMSRRIRAQFAAQFQALGRTQANHDEPAPHSSKAAIDVARIAQLVQQALLVELDFLARRQAACDEARTHEQRRWQADQDQRRANELRGLLQALATQSGNSTPSTRVEPPVPPHWSPTTGAPPSPSDSSRPPEPMHTPLPRPHPLHEPDPPELELSDEELDALPPELPSTARPRRRPLPSPKKPRLSDL
ncbi:hypothetical protein WKW80_19810 [Variovorax humicola]|uniref:Uncharacterized protein n=1 Tax=Variovorax humicola TaxID=1769758 RepID=A0ABU8W3Q8_9BURK